MKHPIQPLVADEHGNVRFKKNAIVAHLATGIANHLVLMDFSNEDRAQLEQLTGCSLGHYCDSPYVSREEYEAAKLAYSRGLTPDQARILALESELAELRKAARAAVELLNELLPEDE